MIHLEQINKVYRTDRIETVALADINLHIDQGEFVSIRSVRYTLLICSR